MSTIPLPRRRLAFLLWLAAACTLGLPGQAPSPPASRPMVARGQDTELHLAARRGDVATARWLIAEGASLRARNGVGATPLHGAIGSLELVQLMIGAGAEVDAVMDGGATPLLVAIGRADSAAVVDVLLNKGADPTAVMTDVFAAPWSAVVRAADVGDAALVARLLQDGRVRQAAPLLGLALVQASFRGHLAVVDRLLAAGVDPNHSDFLSGHALNRALYADQRDVALRLLPYTKDLKRTSGLATAVPTTMWAAYNESGDPRLLRAVLAAGGDHDALASNGESLRRWAEKRGDTPMLAELRRRGAIDAGPARKQKTAMQRSIPAIASERDRLRRTSVQKALSLLQATSDGFLANPFVQSANCVSCHHQSLPAMAYGRARQRGYRLDEASLARQLWAQEREWRPATARAYALTDPVPDAPNTLGFAMLGLHALAVAHDPTVEAMTWFLAESQRADGSFAANHRRPPIEEGPIVGTALAVGALRVLPPKNSARRLDDMMARARTWLAAQRPDSRNQQLFQLLGLGWAGAGRATLEPLADAAVALQGADGGTAPFASAPADAWTTALLVFTLRESGFGESYAEAIRLANDWLLRTQHEDGSWWQESRSWPLQPHFDAGFPHGKDQWIAAAATALAAIALLDEDPAQSPRDAFGSAQELAMRRRSPGGRPMAPSAADSPTSGAAPTFEADVLPVLQRSCIPCHSGDKPKGGLRVGTRAGLLAGGASKVPAVTPGHPELSPLLRHVTDQIEDLEMPPLARRGKYPPLDADQVATLRRWIEHGAQ